MITRVDHMIIGSKVIAGEWTSATKGQIVIANEQFKAFDAATAKSLYIGVCTGEDEDGNKIIKWSDRIQKESNPRYSFQIYAPQKAATATIDLTNAEIVKGHRYVLRILYKDIEAANLQFTHTYEVVASSDVAADLANEFKAKIDKHSNKRVNAAVEGAVLTLTAKAKNYDNSVNALDEYSIVAMQAALYVTIPGALLSNQPEAVSGAVIENVAGNPGKGEWKQVRDMERRAMGYAGHVFTGAYPSIEQEMMTVKGVKYNIVIIENDNLYLSPDNQYIKTTPCRTIICCEDVSTMNDFNEQLKEFNAKSLDNEEIGGV